MPLLRATGDLLDSPAQALVSPVNCVGVAGAGLARQFRERWPKQVGEYTEACGAGLVRPGAIHMAKLPGGRMILSAPTKRHWRDASTFDDVELTVQALAWFSRQFKLGSMAVPALGCGLGGLPRYRIRGLIEREMTGLTCVVHVYGLDVKEEA